MEKQPIYEFGYFQLDSAQQILLCDGERVQLNRKTFQIVLALVEAEGRVVSKDELLAKVWPDVVVEENNLTKNISLLRKALGNGSESLGSDEFIETIPKVGYRFRAEALTVRRQNGFLKETSSAANQKAGQKAGRQPENSTEAKAAEAAPAPPVVKSAGRRWLRTGLIIAIVTGAVVVGWKWRQRQNDQAPVNEFAPVRLTHHVARDLFPAYSPDGKKIAFTSNRDGLPAIYVMNLDGSDVRKVSGNSLDCHFPYWSVDGTKILFTARDATGKNDGYEVNANGSGLVKLPNHLIQRSSDGEKVVFVKELIPGSKAGHEIFMANAVGSDEVRLTNNQLLDVDPFWSPDGKRIAFTCFPDGFVDGEKGNPEICAMDADGKNWVRLTNDSAQDQVPFWSPDGTRIAFFSTRNCKDGAAIHVMNADGSNAMQLTECQTFGEGASWSPDSKRFAYTSDRDGNIEIYSINADPSHQVNLTYHSAEDSEPTWSPDSKRIAFVSNREGKNSIFIMDADGNDQRKLVSNTASRLSWSPDGKQISFDADWAGNFDIYIANADGGVITQLTRNQANETLPAWSPDGKKILFNVTRDKISQLYVMNADGSGVTRISNSSEHEWQHDWSPDGQQIVFTRSRNRSVQRDIWMMNSNGSNPHLIAFAPDNDEFVNPRFSPDGKRLVYQRLIASPRQWDVWVMNADGSEQTRLTHLGGGWPAWSPDGKKIAFYSGRRTGNCEIYRMDVASR